MPEILYDNKKVYFETHGEGEPLILLNGIMMSHLSWKFFIPHLSKNKKVILFDFLDQGKSDKLEGVDYKQDLQVEVLKALIDHLKIEKANILGISYGGEIALQFAIKYPAYINKLLIFNTTSYTTPWLKDIGRGWVKAANTYDPETFYYVSIPYIYSPAFYTTNYKWMENRKKILQDVFTKDFLDAMVRLIYSSEGYDIRNKLKKVNVDTLVVASDFDYVTPLFEQEYIHNNIKNSKFVQIKNCGHASMYEKPTEFVLLIEGFLSGEQDLSIV